MANDDPIDRLNREPIKREVIIIGTDFGAIEARILATLATKHELHARLIDVTGNPADALEQMAELYGEALGLEVDRDAFKLAKMKLEEPVELPAFVHLPRERTHPTSPKGTRRARRGR